MHKSGCDNRFSVRNSRNKQLWHEIPAMIDLRNVMSPIETANGLPNACYVDDAMFTHERNTLFRDSWAAICLLYTSPSPRD